ncbi:hypothetical protein [Pseudoramibacter porci]|uniref:Uncharacterized protein n=1 Tax=Pseudoramibacter porci TaxID=2606631 RepID=A0A7X2T997_9FIRM|nr:hypothetical protein [Pseudoramibacter porci]MSS19147.1 hypothetical protein [Pseudoramibacter porci]
MRDEYSNINKYHFYDDPELEYYFERYMRIRAKKGANTDPGIIKIIQKKLEEFPDDIKKQILSDVIISNSISITNLKKYRQAREDRKRMIKPIENSMKENYDVNKDLYKWLCDPDIGIHANLYMRIKFDCSTFDKDGIRQLNKELDAIGKERAKSYLEDQINKYK